VGNNPTILIEERMMDDFSRFHVSAIAVLLLVSIGSARADEGDVAQTRTQERNRAELNLQIPTADFAQSQNREEHTVMNQNQNKYQYQYRNNYRNGSAGSGEAMKKYNTANIWQGNNDSSSGSGSGPGSMDRMNATNRYMQGSTATGTMNRQSAASRSAVSRSMGGGRR
jgi:hypothetical protein